MEFFVRFVKVSRIGKFKDNLMRLEVFAQLQPLSQLGLDSNREGFVIPSTIWIKIGINRTLRTQR
jgi:hypothetical protein